MRMSLISAAIASVVLVFAPPPPAVAGMRDRSVEVGPYFTYGNFDNESNIENDGGLGGRLGILFNKQHELEFSIDQIDTEDNFGGQLDVQLTSFKLGYIYNFAPSKAVVPFLTSGLGWQNLQISQDTFDGSFELDDQDDPLAYVGFGVRFFVGPVFNIRGEAQAVGVFPDGDLDDALIDGVFNVGIGWVIGGH